MLDNAIDLNHDRHKNGKYKICAVNIFNYNIEYIEYSGYFRK